jgi:Na+/melibiose symporter-like transporter
LPEKPDNFRTTSKGWIAVNVYRRTLYICGEIGMMVLARFLLQWILGFGDTNPASTGSAAVAGGDGSMPMLTLFSGAAIGIALIGFRIFDGITDPLAGIVTDLWVQKGHQRRSLLWFSIFLLPVGLALCFSPTHAMDPGERWFLLGAGMFAFFVGYTFYGIPYWSLIEDYGRDNANERRILSNLLGAGIIIATAIAGLVSPLLVELYGYKKAALALAIPAGVLMMFPYFAAPRGSRSLTSEAQKHGTSLFAILMDTLRHRRFFSVLVMFSGSQMSFTIMTAALVFIAGDLLGGTEADVVRIMGPFLTTAIPAFIFVPRFSRMLGWEKAILVASLALGVAYAASAGLGEAWIGSKWLTASIVFALAGPMAAVLFGLEGEAVTACARERGAEDYVSIYFGVYNFIVKTLNGLAIWIAGWLLDLSKIPQYGTGAIRAMSLTAGSLLAVCVVIYLIVRPRSGHVKRAS